VIGEDAPMPKKHPQEVRFDTLSIGDWFWFQHNPCTSSVLLRKTELDKSRRCAMNGNWQTNAIVFNKADDPVHIMGSAQIRKYGD